MSVTVGKGRSAITIDGPITEDLEEELNRLLGPVLDALRAYASSVTAPWWRSSWSTR